MLCKRAGFFIVITIFSLFWSCAEKISSKIPFDPWEHIPAPADNAITEDRIKLGKRIFNDKALSLDSTISCASCHLESIAFTDSVSIHTGIKGRKGHRNSPDLFNLAFQPNFFRDGGARTIELQILGPLQDSNEMGLGMVEAVRRLELDSSYQEMARVAYERPIDAFVISRSVGCYIRTLISRDALYDSFLESGDSSVFNVDQKEGLKLFMGKGGCVNCHSGVDLTNYGFENIGLYEEYVDSGRARITLDSKDDGKFRVPSLRNVSRTAPYMHDGSIKTLEKVLEHYNIGGGNNWNKSDKISNLGLTEHEMKQLIAFLETLTGNKLIGYEGI